MNTDKVDLGWTLRMKIERLSQVFYMRAPLAWRLMACEGRKRGDATRTETGGYPLGLQVSKLPYGIEAGTRLVGAKVAVTHDDCLGVEVVQVLQQ